MEKRRRVLLNDVLLREGAQVAGGAMSPQDQLIYVQYLMEGGIDRIEIGFPGSSKEQFEQCRRIVKFVREWNGDRRKPFLSGLARAKEEDIKAVRDAGCDICHIYLPSSDQLMLTQFDSAKYGDTPEGKREWSIGHAVQMVQFAKTLGFKHVEYSPEDAARTSLEFLSKVVKSVIDAGADIVNIPDTTGLRVGEEFGHLISHLFANVFNIERAVISVHCHNDSDHSTHNALQAVLAGAGQIEGTFYGLGERSGMTKFESVVMNINTRLDIFSDIEIGFDRGACVKIVNFVANALGMPVPRHWVVSGSQNTLCSSGTHQAIEARASAKGKASAYYSWNPKEYGHGGVEIAINQSSGKVGLSKKLETLGYKVTEVELEEIYGRTKRISEVKGGAIISDRELTAVVQDAVAQIPFPIIVRRCQAIGGEGTIPTATVIIEVDGKTSLVAQTGDGPYDAIMKAVKQAVSQFYPVLRETEIILDDWRPVPVTKGAEALADVYARIKVRNGGDAVFAGRAVHLDTNQASAQAFANCFSWYLASIKK